MVDGRWRRPEVSDEASPAARVSCPATMGVAALITPARLLVCKQRKVCAPLCKSWKSLLIRRLATRCRRCSRMLLDEYLVGSQRIHRSAGCLVGSQAIALCPEVAVYWMNRGLCHFRRKWVGRLSLTWTERFVSAGTGPGSRRTAGRRSRSTTPWSRWRRAIPLFLNC
jgi:hypothetical protein